MEPTPPNTTEPDEIEPTLDLGRVEYIRSLAAGGGGLLRELSALFFTDADERLTSMRAAVASGDAEALRRAAHALRGAAATIGAPRLTTLCERLQRTADSSGSVDVDAVADEVERVRVNLRV